VHLFKTAHHSPFQAPNLPALDYGPPLFRPRATNNFVGISGIEREHVIAEACLQGAKLAELNDRRQQLERQLVEIYGTKLDKPKRRNRRLPGRYTPSGSATTLMSRGLREFK
jgi:hypothetical protein